MWINEVISVHLLACRGSAAHSSPINQDRAGPSEFQSFSDSLRSRLNAVSLKYDFLENSGCVHELCILSNQLI